jgi:Initiator Replication protein
MPNSSPVIIKNNFLIETSGKIDFLGIKLFNSLFHFAYNEIHDKEKHKITYSEIKKYLGYQNKININQTRKALNSLLSFVIQWDIFDEKSGETLMGGSALISGYNMEKGFCEFSFSPYLRERLLVDILYTKINLKLQNQFSGKYSLRMYELAKEFYRQKEGVGETKFITIDSLRNFLGVADGKYADFRVFNQKVLFPTVDEINKLSDVNVDLVFEKQGAKVVGVKLKIKKNSDDVNKKLQDKEVLSQKDVISTQPNPLKTSILSLGINEKQINEWLDQYPIEYIQSKYDITIEQLKFGKIKTSPTGFLIRAIEQDFGSKQNNVEDILIQDALEARKLNPETIIVDPFEFHSQKDLLTKLDLLRTQHYNPIVIQSELENAQKLKWIK